MDSKGCAASLYERDSGGSESNQIDLPKRARPGDAAARNLSVVNGCSGTRRVIIHAAKALLLRVRDSFLSGSALQLSACVSGQRLHEMALRLGAASSQRNGLYRRLLAGGARRLLCLPALGLVAAAAVIIVLRMGSEPRRGFRCGGSDGDANSDAAGQSDGRSSEARAAAGASRPMAANAGSSRDDVTLVTGYWNIGEIPKKDESNHKYPDLYYGWLRFFANIQNPVVGYFDDAKAAAIFEESRRGLPTEIVMTNQSSMWSFSLAGRIKEIIDRPDYPKWMPNTIYPLYDCATHAKFEVVRNASRRNYFGTRYVAWLDVGLFRDLAQANDRSPFYMGVPRGYDEALVAFDEVRPWRNMSVEHIMKDSPVWVCGCFFLARVDTMSAFVDEYVRFTEKFLDAGLANTEQNVIMAMYTGQNPDRPKVGIQAYPFDPRYDRWYSLGYLLRERGLAERGLGAPKAFH